MPRRRGPRRRGTSMDLTLNSGVEMPALGFGVFQTPADVSAASVEEALRVGYRLIDTAASYFNEREVGDGIRRSGLDRSEVFIETKVWISAYGYDETLHAFEKSAGKLGVDQIDLPILHQALPSAFDRSRHLLEINYARWVPSYHTGADRWDRLRPREGRGFDQSSSSSV